LIIPYPSPFTPVKNPYSYYDMDMIFTLDQSYYYLVSFLLILIAGVVISYFISQLLASFTEELFVPFPFDGIGGAIIGFISHYLAIFIILFTLSTIPYDFIQNTLTNSLIGDSMITSSPGLSKKTYNHFILDVYDKEIKNLPEMELKDLKEKVETEENQESNE
ncbi:MAG: CvpA family protein, partial [Atopostipes suicloacalis]|nr:CvpA family protein [Atopostipes suicloacalis]